MNYYIQGDAAKAEQIKAAFEELGCDTTGWKFNVEGEFYYTHDGKIDLACGKFLINLIKTHPDYKELQLTVEPNFKVGDWLVYKNGDTFAGGFKEVQVKTVEEINRYAFTNNTNGSCNFIDRNCRLWTIADAKDGDVLVTTKIRNCPFIYRKTSRNNGLAYYYAGVDGDGDFCEGCLKRTLYHFGSVENVVPATKEQRDLLFAKMREAGYEWDADKKELRKIQQHYDISNFKPFDKVLVRDDDDEPWRIAFYGYYNKEAHYSHFVGTCWGKQCIPYNDDTKHLLGTTDMPSEEYINW